MTFPKLPCTVLTIMCLIAKVAVECAGSTCRSTASAGAANSRSARAVFMSSLLPVFCTERSAVRLLGDLPETDQRRGIPAGFLQNYQRPLGQRAAGDHVFERIERSAHLVARLGRPGGEPGARGEE